MGDLHLWHSDKNFTELAETKYPESSGVIYNLYEDCICMREEIERLSARVKDLEETMTQLQAFYDAAQKEQIENYDDIIESTLEIRR